MAQGHDFDFFLVPTLAVTALALFFGLTYVGGWQRVYLRCDVLKLRLPLVPVPLFLSFLGFKAFAALAKLIMVTHFRKATPTDVLRLAVFFFLVFLDRLGYPVVDNRIFAGLALLLEWILTVDFLMSFSHHRVELM